MRGGVASFLCALVYVVACGSPQQTVLREQIHTCGKSTPHLVHGNDTGFGECERSGMIHREQIRACASFVPRPAEEVRRLLYLKDEPSALPSLRCVQDQDCAGANSYCKPVEPPGHSSYCHEGCSEDSDCSPGRLCLCDYPAGRCVEAQCRSDQDCGNGLLCGSFVGVHSSCVEGVEPVGFACQTPKDECANLWCGDRASGWSGRCGLDQSGKRYCETDYESCPIR